MTCNADLVKEQLPELKPEQILLEPTRRNTAPLHCVGFLSYPRLESERQYSGSSFGPLNPEGRRISGSYRKKAGLRSQSDNLLTLGIKPNRPETGYGYIQIAEAAGDNFYKVKTFTEKPELELAKVFVESGEFYWNSGLFMWNVNTIIKANEALLPRG